MNAYFDSNQPRKRGRPIRQGRTPVPPTPAPVVTPSEHVIHDDGTYSNARSTKQVNYKTDLKRNDTLVFGKTVPVSSGVVHKIVKHGVYCRPDKDNLPDLSRCIFYNWDEIETLCTEVV